jgi:hypothetical protein
VDTHDVNVDVQEVEGQGPVVVRKAVGRRQLIKGSVAVAGGVVAASYVKPDLRSFGVAYVAAQSGRDPLNFTDGTIGFWQNPNNEDVWDEKGAFSTNPDAADTDWTAANPYDGVNPFNQDDLFVKVFSPTADSDDALNTTSIADLLDVLSKTPNPNAGEVNTAAQLVAAYLNASYFGQGGTGFAFNTTQLTAAWNTAVKFDTDTADEKKSDAKYVELQNILEAANKDQSLATIQALPGYSFFFP